MSRHTAVLGPTGTAERALAPDLARGFMLLFIALANTVWYLWAVPNSGATMHPEPEGVLDGVAQFFTVMAVDMRSYPMFAFLFGYGMVQLARRQQAAGASERSVNALLRRRNLWLLVFGFFHALLLWMGDILGAYGLAGLVLGWLFFRRRDVTLLVWGGVLTGLMALLAAVSLLALPFVGEADTGAGAQAGFDLSQAAANIGDPSPLSAALLRVMTWPLVVVGQGLLGLAVPTAILLGFWAARRGFLEEPGRHLRALRRTAVIGISVGWLGGLPMALAQIGVWDLTAARECVKLQPDYVKVPSACNLNMRLLELLAEEFPGDVHVSLGMTTPEEEDGIVELVPGALHVEGHGVLEDRVAGVAQDALLPVEEGDLRHARARVAEAGVVGDGTGLRAQLTDVDGHLALGAEPADPVQVNQEIQGLKEHRHEHEARGLQKMPRDRPRREVLHAERSL